MRKLYSYKDLHVSLADDAEAVFSVELISDGNVITTTINIPNLPPDQDPVIEDAGSVSIGKGKDLRGDAVVVFSDIVNLIPQEDTVEIHYKVNGALLVAHKNPKSEAVRPMVLLLIKFVP